MHRSVRVADERRVLIFNFPRLCICHSDLVRRVLVLFFADIQVVVDEQLAKGNFLLVFLAAEFVRDHATVAIVDYILIARAAKRQMVDLVREVKFPATLHKLHDSLWAVVRAQVEVPWHLVHSHLPFDLASFLVLKLLLRRAKDHVLIAFDGLLTQGVRDTLDLTFTVEGVLVQAALVVNLVHAGHINDIESENGAGSLWQSQVDVQEELKA